MTGIAKAKSAHRKEGYNHVMLKAKIGEGGARSKILFYDFCEAKRNKTENNSKRPDYYDICKLFLKLFLLVMYKSMSNSCSFLTKSKASFAILFEMEFIIQL